MGSKSKTFAVNGTDGQKLDAEQLATFAHYIGNEQFRFVVTRLPGQHAVLTHRASGSKVVEIPYMAQFASLGDYTVAGKAELEKLIARVGAARVASVLRGAEH
ncbi:hypothetical protein ACGYQ5_14220 [Burkholderia pseudomallei]